VLWAFKESLGSRFIGDDHPWGVGSSTGGFVPWEKHLGFNDGQRRGGSQGGAYETQMRRSPESGLDLERGAFSLTEWCSKRPVQPLCENLNTKVHYQKN
jgi:hypothetical protein